MASMIIARRSSGGRASARSRLPTVAVTVDDVT
jgi:hypothetical protein